MRIQVHKCRVTGKIFEEKDLAKYMAHLKTVRAGQKEKRLHEKIRVEFKEWLKQERSEIYDPLDVVPWFIKNQRYIMDATNAIKFEPRSRYFEGFHSADKFTDITMDLEYSPNVSNTHQCPDDGVTNWGNRDTTKPRGYPGWHGYIKGVLLRLPKYDSSYPYSEALNLVGIKTGSGGGGNSDWGYDVKLFLADWPGMGQTITLNKLKGIL